MVTLLLAALGCGEGEGVAPAVAGPEFSVPRAPAAASVPLAAFAERADCQDPAEAECAWRVLHLTPTTTPDAVRALVEGPLSAPAVEARRARGAEWPDALLIVVPPQEPASPALRVLATALGGVTPAPRLLVWVEGPPGAPGLSAAPPGPGVGERLSWRVGAVWKHEDFPVEGAPAGAVPTPVVGVQEGDPWSVAVEGLAAVPTGGPAPRLTRLKPLSGSGPPPSPGAGGRVRWSADTPLTVVEVGGVEPRSRMVLTTEEPAATP